MNILLAFHQNDWRRCHYSPEKYFRGPEHQIWLAATEMTPYWTDWYHRIPYYLPKGIPISIRSLEKKFNTRFDLVVEFDSSGQYHLVGKKEVSIPTLLWSNDTHLMDKRLFQSYFQKDFDIVYVAHKDYAGFFNKTPCRWLPFACDPDFHKKINVPKVYDVTCVGNLDPKVYPERVKHLEGLAKKFKVHMFHKVYGEDMIKIMNQSKIVFNKTFNGDLNFRVFETLACGSFLITDRTANGLQDLFEDGRHLAMYGDQAELEEKVAYYLAHEDKRETIAACGQQEVYAKHTFYHRAKTMLADAEKISNRAS